MAIVWEVIFMVWFEKEKKNITKTTKQQILTQHEDTVDMITVRYGLPEMERSIWDCLTCWTYDVLEQAC